MPDRTIPPHELVLAVVPAGDGAVPRRVARRLLREEAGAGVRSPHLADVRERQCDLDREDRGEAQTGASSRRVGSATVSP
jgi:hypothetical protein